MIPMLTYFFVVVSIVTALASPAEPRDHSVSPKVRAAMKYHGILFSSRDELTKKSWFIRDGKRCRLFTEAFLKNYNKGDAAMLRHKGEQNVRKN